MDCNGVLPGQKNDDIMELDVICAVLVLLDVHDWSVAAISHVFNQH